jgi:molecular chaperone DnaK
MFNDNKEIGRFDLTDIPPAPRGVPQIEVTFDIDANGILSVSAKDKGTGKEQSIKIQASSGLSDEEIERMKKEAQENSAADAKRKEEVEIFNKADGLIFQTEKQLKEFGEKLSADKKAAIEAAHGELKTAFEAKNADDVKAKTEALDAAWMAASEELYAAGQEAQGADAGAQNAGNAGGEDVQDADFEEVK